ncbi:hypothetical protein NDU88_002471 [Pleurodeles waltl]|uniref:Uncharacterized protein n=1 Tax=Pleurodeles waltl TaxID=8319 RepID=A0AAV7RE08_PLEWA|nr:hypothetical protein NDU88_002471 [Pleurodeles waltl]
MSKTSRLRGYAKEIGGTSACLGEVQRGDELGRGHAPRKADWLKDAAYCQKQRIAYWEMMRLRSHLTDIWLPLQMHLMSQA